MHSLLYTSVPSLLTPRLNRQEAEKNSKHHVKAYGLTTGTSSLVSHLQRDHAKAYQKYLDLKSAGTNSSTIGDIFQSTLDPHLQPVADRPSYSPQRLALACLKLISACDLVSVTTLSAISVHLSCLYILSHSQQLSYQSSESSSCFSGPKLTVGIYRAVRRLASWQ